MSKSITAKNAGNTPDKKIPSPSKKQLSKKDLQNIARPYAYKALMKAAELIDKADNDSVKLGAAKLILAKVMPDMKATELTADEQIRFVLEIVQDNKLRDANREKDTTTDKAISEPK